MSFLPINTSLGQLEILEIYDYYDRPVLFACRNASNNIYLAVLENEEDNQETWLYVNVSQLRFDNIRSGAIDLKSAFTQSENNSVFEINIFFDDRPIQVELITSKDIADERLPLAGEKLSLSTITLQPLDHNLVRKAYQAQREYVNLSLNFDDENRTEAPVKLLANILATVQNVIHSLGFALSDLYSQSVKITEDLISITEFSVLDLGAGSFEVEMAASKSGQMPIFDAELLSNVLNSFTELMNVQNSEEDLQRTLTSYKKVEVAKEYFKFLQVISRSSINQTNLTWASPINGRSGTGNLTSAKVFSALEILRKWSETSTDTIEIVGKLTGLFTTGSRRFEVEDSDGKRITGTVSSDVTVDDFEIIRNATISQRYRATIRRKITTKIATGEVKTQHQLLKFETP